MKFKLGDQVICTYFEGGRQPAYICGYIGAEAPALGQYYIDIAGESTVSSAILHQTLLVPESFVEEPTELEQIALAGDPSLQKKRNVALQVADLVAKMDSEDVYNEDV